MDPLYLVRGLDPATPLDDLGRGDQLDALGKLLAKTRVCPDGRVRIVESEPDGVVSGQDLADEVEEVLRRPDALKRGVDLLGRLLDVAEVRDEHAQRGAHQRETVAAGVSGQ